MFITSRESAITFSFSRNSQLCLFLPGPLRKSGEPSPRSKRVRVYFGVLSISQREERASPRISPGFVGFYGVFLDSAKSGLAVDLCRLYVSIGIPQQVVVPTRLGHRSPELR